MSDDEANEHGPPHETGDIMSPRINAEGQARGSHDTVLAGKVGAAIIAARHPEVTQADLARRTGIDQPTLSKLERGLRPTPLTVYEMLEIERATGRPTGWILQRAGLTNATDRDLASVISADATVPAIARRMLVAALREARAAAVELEREHASD